MSYGTLNFQQPYGSMRLIVLINLKWLEMMVKVLKHMDIKLSMLIKFMSKFSWILGFGRVKM